MGAKQGAEMPAKVWSLGRARALGYVAVLTRTGSLVAMALVGVLVRPRVPWISRVPRRLGRAGQPARASPVSTRFRRVLEQGGGGERWSTDRLRADGQGGPSATS